MRKFFLLAVFNITFYRMSLAQQTIRLIPDNSKIEFLKAEPGGSSAVSRDVKVKVEFWGTEPATNQVVTFAIVNSSSAALGPTLINPPIGGFVIPHGKFRSEHDSMEFTLHVQINALPALVASESFQLQMNGAANLIHLVTVLPMTPPSTPAREDDPKRYRLMFLNALNFDFTGALTSNYVGSINLFVPPAKGNRWGYNTGILKISYSGSDSLSSRYRIENVTIKPLDTIGIGSKYLRELNKYSTTTQNTVWSLFVQPLFRISNKNQENCIYLHAHAELLVNKWYTKTTITNVQRDTMTLNSGTSNGFVAHGIFSTTNNYSTTLLNGYFGIGLTFDLVPWKDANFFFQPTIGMTTNYPQPAAMDISDNANTGYARVLGDKSWYGFYLVRTYLSQKVSDTATIVLGADIRGLFPKYNPQYAIYLGLNLQVQGILGLLGIKVK